MGSQIEKPHGPGQSTKVQEATIDKLDDPDWAWAAYKPDTQRPWNLALAGHLYRRAAFGANWEQLQQTLSNGPQQTIDKLLKPEADVAAFNRDFDEHETAAAGSATTLRAWWLRRIIETPHPLLEKMTLFWHSHFAVSAAQIKEARLMQRYVQLLRSQALGSFGALLQGISQDPAMLLWLGAEVNRKAKPNDSFAKPLLEVFTLGPGHYTDKDVQEVARAFTGWFVLRGQLRYIPREHDDGIKHILGRQGNFTGEDVVKLLLEQKATAQRLICKLYSWLISEVEQPDTKLIAPLVEAFAKDYDLSKVVATMLRSNLFFSKAAYRQRIKCPVEFALGIIKGLEGLVSTTELGQALAHLGQNLYYPPTVKGWTGGRYWINDATLVGRHNLSMELLQKEKPYGGKLNPWAIANKQGNTTPQSAARFIVELFLQSGLDSDIMDTVLKSEDLGGNPELALRRFTQAVVTLPEFNLA